MFVEEDGFDVASYMAYYSNYGEVESRNVAFRLNLTEEQRRNVLLDASEDVQEKSLTFIESSLFTNKLNVKSSKLSGVVSKQALKSVIQSITKSNPNSSAIDILNDVYKGNVVEDFNYDFLNGARVNIRFIN